LTVAGAPIWPGSIERTRSRSEYSGKSHSPRSLIGGKPATRRSSRRVGARARADEIFAPRTGARREVA